MVLGSHLRSFLAFGSMVEGFSAAGARDLRGWEHMVVPQNRGTPI